MNSTGQMFQPQKIDKDERNIELERCMKFINSDQEFSYGGRGLNKQKLTDDMKLFIIELYEKNTEFKILRKKYK